MSPGVHPGQASTAAAAELDGFLGPYSPKTIDSVRQRAWVLSSGKGVIQMTGLSSFISSIL